MEGVVGEARAQYRRVRSYDGLSIYVDWDEVRSKIVVQRYLGR